MQVIELLEALGLGSGEVPFLRLRNFRLKDLRLLDFRAEVTTLPMGALEVDARGTTVQNMQQ